MMVLHSVDENIKPLPDAELGTIADYVIKNNVGSELALTTARFSLMDALGCAILALRYPACTKLLGPVIPGTIVPIGVRVPGTSYILDPILAVTDYMCRKNAASNINFLTVKDVLLAMIKAHEIQGIIALENAFNRLGFDHVILVKIASTAIATYLLGGTREQIIDALSQAWLDGVCLRTYRHAPNAGSRKSWAAGDASSRATRLAWLTMQGEMGYPSVLTAKKWGFYDTITHGALRISRTYGSYVMENVLFKVSYPAEFHAQTAVECAVSLFPQVNNRWDQIEKI